MKNLEGKYLPFSDVIKFDPGMMTRC